MTVLGSDVVVMGGYRFSSFGSFSAPASVERYNRRLQRWDAMPSLIDPLMVDPPLMVVVWV